MTVVFWASLLGILYVYLGYPFLLALWRWVAPRPVRKAQYEPTVTILIAAHNERQRIEKKIRNCFQLDYPRRKLQIVVSLDGPTDGTEFVVWKYAPQGVQIVHSGERHGKAAALNAGIKRATGDIVVFADTRQTFERQAVRRLVENFSDPDVGAATGELVLLNEDHSEAKSEIGLYWKYEKWIRSMESDVHSVVGATGAIYAIRRELFRDLPEDTILDDVLTPMRIVFDGKRVVFEPEAKAFDTVACCPRAEFGRKVRTLTGNFQLAALMPHLFVPWKNPVFWQFCSHKAGRLLVPYLLLAMLISNAALIGGIYSWLLAAQFVWYVCAAAGHYVAAREVTTPVVVEEQRRAA